MVGLRSRARAARARGLTEADELAGVHPEAGRRLGARWLQRLHPIGRTGSPDDVAATVAFLPPDRTDRVTGAVWDVDGGVMAGRN
jgi:NAD(P)-dependent dehydrogenase (short-subunit alcohol dehydrogenase family)